MTQLSIQADSQTGHYHLVEILESHPGDPAFDAAWRASHKLPGLAEELWSAAQLVAAGAVELTYLPHAVQPTVGMVRDALDRYRIVQARPAGHTLLCGCPDFQFQRALQLNHQVLCVHILAWHLAWKMAGRPPTDDVHQALFSRKEADYVLE